ncbi:uncharacterized protein UV8b_00737 [Ustilaginoidea virens]|uniref:Uncharacterized protein n=1 Tax=Ustilaginoidea virens TaxID=1159556 RepID=A0A8E5HJB5_USTVR|nr:uncharacterized protein UV8b_00737 [Ustilaginoidea virens]QUC16496.1 hypothetical protein UV8b_00737 [Ustilaginoidea virens]
MSPLRGRAEAIPSTALAGLHEARSLLDETVFGTPSTRVVDVLQTLGPWKRRQPLSTFKPATPDLSSVFRASSDPSSQSAAARRLPRKRQRSPVTKYIASKPPTPRCSKTEQPAESRNVGHLMAAELLHL